MELQVSVELLRGAIVQVAVVVVVVVVLMSYITAVYKEYCTEAIT